VQSHNLVALFWRGVYNWGVGSFIELNDTLRISNEQGFPLELDIKKHFGNPYSAEMFKDKIFRFKNKNDIRVYQLPPIRNFLVQDIGGKWLYWGLCHIVEITHDYTNKTTSGKFKIIYINTPEEMKFAFDLIDRVEGKNYFA
jgi:hypothetical protein